MRNRWDEAEARRWADGLEACVYASRLLGAEPSLVLYGGGNTSVKVAVNGEAVLYVKGSGADLAHVQDCDFTPVRLAEVRRLIDARNLSNDQLSQAVSEHVVKQQAPRPSIETLLHACLPQRYVMHTHADSILALTNCERGEQITAQVFGELAPRVPFHESGFELAKAAYEVYREEASADSIGLILLHHGVFSFGNSARAAYENMLELVARAEQFLASQGAWQLPGSEVALDWGTDQIAALRRELSHAAGFSLVIHLLDTPQARAFARHSRAAQWWEEGPATPQHAVFVKRKPLFGRDVACYVEEYRSEVARLRPGSTLQALGLDPAPRVVIDPQVGIWTASIDAAHARMTAEIFRHDLEIMSRASAHDRYAGLPRSALLDAEIHYGGFEAKMRARYLEEECLLGEVALLACGKAASAIARALADCGAEVASSIPAEGMTLDLRPSANNPQAYLRELIREVGGLDILILSPEQQSWLPDSLALLEHAPRGGRVVLMGPTSWSAAIRAALPGTDRISVSAIDPKLMQLGALAKEIVQMCVRNVDLSQTP